MGKNSWTLIFKNWKSVYFHFLKMFSIAYVYNWIIENKFVSEDIKNMWEVVRNKEEFEILYSKYRYSRKT